MALPWVPTAVTCCQAPWSLQPNAASAAVAFALVSPLLVLDEMRLNGYSAGSLQLMRKHEGSCVAPITCCCKRESGSSLN